MDKINLITNTEINKNQASKPLPATQNQNLPQIETLSSVKPTYKVKDEKKYDYYENIEIQEAISKIEKEFSGNGRVLIRTSGTEPLVRVMIEGSDKEKITIRAKELANLIEDKLN